MFRPAFFIFIFAASFNLAFADTVRLLDQESQGLHYLNEKGRVESSRRRLLNGLKQILKKERLKDRNFEQSLESIEEKFNRFESQIETNLPKILKKKKKLNRIGRGLSRLTTQKLSRQQVKEILIEGSSKDHLLDLRERLQEQIVLTGSFKNFLIKLITQIEFANFEELNWGGGSDGGDPDGLANAIGLGFLILAIGFLSIGILGLGLLIGGIVIIVGGTTTLGVIGASLMIALGGLVVVWFIDAFFGNGDLFDPKAGARTLGRSLNPEEMNFNIRFGLDKRLELTQGSLFTV